MSNRIHMDRIPTIDFETHPAFRQMDMERSPNDAIVQRLLEEIERGCEGIVANRGWSNARLAIEYREKIRPKFEQLKSIATANQRLDPWFRDFTLQAIERASEFLLEDLYSRICASTRGGAPSGEAQTACLQAVLHDGFCRMGVDAALAEQVWRGTRWERSVLRRRAEIGPGRHCALALEKYSPGSLLIQESLREKGVIDTVSAYIGQEMEFIYAALDYSHEKQNWYKDCYLDAGLPTSRTAYMHFDADSDVMKAMLYLRDVRPENGPFRYVRASHRWQRSAVQCSLDKGFDVQQTKTFELENDRLDYKLGYYRPRYKLPEYRKGLSMLPNNLRGSTHFGDDVVDGSPLSVSLLQQEEVFVGPAGTFVVFDGSKGIHRGSQVDEGERWAVQIGMRVVKDTSGGRLPPPVRAAVGKLRYQFRRAKGLLQTWWVN